MKNINDFLNELRLDNGAIWLSNDSLKLFTSKKMQNDETKEFIAKNRSSLIEILKNNGILSKEKFLEVTILKSNLERYYPLSAAQERLWFIEQFEEGTNAYHMPALFEFCEGTEIDGVKYALREIVWRHEILRSTIEQPEDLDHGIQRVHDRPLQIEETTIPEEEDLAALVKSDINRLFLLGTEYPIRVKLYKVRSAGNEKQSRVILLINIHHIAADGWSMDIFQQELFSYYHAYAANVKEFSLPPLEIQYKDYAVWQRAYLAGGAMQKQLNYWKGKLSGFSTLEFPTDYSRSLNIDYHGGSVPFIIDEKIGDKLKALVRNNGATFNTVLLSAFNVLLSKYTGQQDIVTGSPVANRHYSQTADLIGFFVNTMVNRTILDNNQSFEELIQQVHREQIQMQLNQDLPFEKLVEELGMERDTSRHAVFQIMFSVQNFGGKEVGDTFLKPFSMFDFYEMEKFDLSVTIDVSGSELKGRIGYATGLFQKDTIHRLAHHYIYLLRQLTDVPSDPYERMSLLDPCEYNKIVYEWNSTERDYPRGKSLTQLFEDQVERSPNNIALVCDGRELTYRELNARSNQLARQIRLQYQRAGCDLLPDTLIALYLNRSPEMVIGILGVLKAGGAYVPINSEYPKEKIEFLLADTCAKIIITQQQLLDEQPKLPDSKVMLIDMGMCFYQEEEASNLDPQSGSEDLAYVIYTSGTTGKPKGVKIEHHSVVNKVNYLIRAHGIDATFNIGSKIPYTFDPSVREIFLALLTGARLTIISSELYDTDKLLSIIKSSEINLLVFVPSHLKEFLSSVKNAQISGEDLKNLKIIYSCGELLPSDLVRDLKYYLPHLAIRNQYGPTEACQFSFEFDCDTILDYELGKQMPVGKIIDNGKAYILDSYLNPVPIKAVGEIYIGGDGLSRGYLNLPELTTERFMVNPFATESDKNNAYTHIYKTGDLARWLPDGNVEFIGRNDDQVKIRGYRIELGEIETALLQVSGIAQCCVVSIERHTEAGATKYLVAYYVLKNRNTDLSEEIIVSELSKVLVDYMIPSAFVALDFLPLTANGKLDKRALPEPAFRNRDAEFIAPRTEIEVALCRVWQHTLGLERVGVSDDFFRIGGNSILALQVARKTAKAVCQDVRVGDLFRFRTIEALLKNLEFVPEHFTGIIKPYHFGRKNGLKNLILIHPAGAGSEV